MCFLLLRSGAKREKTDSLASAINLALPVTGLNLMGGFTLLFYRCHFEKPMTFKLFMPFHNANVWLAMGSVRLCLDEHLFPLSQWVSVGGSY